MVFERFTTTTTTAAATTTTTGIIISTALQPNPMLSQRHPCPVFSHPSFTLDSGSNSAAVEGTYDSPAYRYVLGSGTYNAVVAAIQSEAVAKGIAAVGGAGVSGAMMIISF